MTKERSVSRKEEVAARGADAGGVDRVTSDAPVPRISDKCSGKRQRLSGSEIFGE